MPAPAVGICGWNQGMTTGEWRYVPTVDRVTIPIGLYAVTAALWFVGAEGFWLGFMVALCAVDTLSQFTPYLIRAWAVFWAWATRP